MTAYTADEIERRARRIIEFELAKMRDDKAADILQYAMRLIRIETAKEVIGESPLRAASAPEDQS